MTIKILHLSDLHFVADPGNNRYVNRLLDHVRTATALRDHVVVVTGDLIDNEGDFPWLKQTPDHNDPGTQALLAAIATGQGTLVALGGLAGLLPAGIAVEEFSRTDKHVPRAIAAARQAATALKSLPQPVIAVPGNHDYALWGNLHDNKYRSAVDAELFRWLKDSRPPRAAPPEALGTSGKKTLWRHRLDGGSFFVDVLGIDTTIEPTQNLPVAAKDFATGCVGKGQLDLLQDYFRRPEVLAGRALAAAVPGLTALGGLLPPGLPPAPADAKPLWVVGALHHSPFPGSGSEEQLMKLSDRDVFLTTAGRQMDLLLFGHLHRRTSPGNGPLALQEEASYASATATSITFDGFRPPQVTRIPMTLPPI